MKNDTSVKQKSFHYVNKKINPLPDATSKNVGAGPRAERPKMSDRDW